MFELQNVLGIKYFTPVFDDGQGSEGAGEGKPNEGKPNEGKPNEGKGSSNASQVTKEDYEKVKKELETTKTQLLEELNAQKTRADLSTEQRNSLDERVRNLQNQLKTKEQLAEEQQRELRNQYETQIESVTKERDSLKDKYVKSTIHRAIIDAASENDAYNNTQLISILSPNTRIEEVLDKEGKPTGIEEVRTTIVTVNDKNETVQLDLTVKEAVKKMSEMKEYANLFKNKGVNGFNMMTGGSSASTVDLSKVTYKDYVEARKKGQIKI